MEGIRKCDVCGSPMSEGFCIHDGEQYFCSDECLHTAYTQEEYEEMYEEDEAYWTTWEDDGEEEEQPATLRVCYKAPGRDIEIREISNSIGALQGLVGGYIEVVRAWSKEVAVLANEEGLLMGLPYNCMGLVGPIVFIGTTATDFRSLTDKEIVDIMYKEGRYETAE